jgi:hypothetical protein
MTNRTAPKPTRAGEAPDDPGRAAPDQPRQQEPAAGGKGRASSTGASEPDDPADALPSRRDRSGIDHPHSTDPGPDLTGVGDI